MAIESNNSTEEVAGGVKYWQGVANFRVIAVNPTLEELKALGVNLKSEPKYTDIDLGEQGMRNKVTFFVENKENEIITRVEFLVSPEKKVASTGKLQFLNKYGQDSWADKLEDISSNPKMNWYKTDGARPALIGEVDLIRFITSWANVAKGGEVSLDTIDNIARGTVTELKQLVQGLKENEVRLLLGVRIATDGKMYQSVYTKWFGRPYTKTNTTMLKRLAEDYGKFNASYDPTDYTLKQFVGGAIPTGQVVAAETEEEDAPWMQD